MTQPVVSPAAGPAGGAVPASLPEGVLMRPECDGDLDAIAHLQADVFGPGRFARTAFRLREKAGALAAYNRVAILGETLVGSVQFWRIEANGVKGVLLGPLAVVTPLKSRGIGKALMRNALGALDADGEGPVILVGDAPYYGPLGFSVVKPGRLVLPGPVDPARLLVMLDREAFIGKVEGVPV